MTSRVRDCEAIVDDPGFGRILLLGVDDETNVEVRAWLLGAAIGHAREGVTTLAFSRNERPTPHRIVGFGFIEVEEARALLPGMQLAAVKAATDTEKYERGFMEDLDEAPRAPVCGDCGAGSAFEQRAYDKIRRCAEPGHYPFGAPVGHSWQEAVKQFEGTKTRIQIRAAFP